MVSKQNMYYLQPVNRPGILIFLTITLLTDMKSVLKQAMKPAKILNLCIP